MKEIRTHVTARTVLEDLILNEIGERQRDNYYMIPLWEVPRVVKFIDTQSRMMVARGCEEGNGEFII